MSFDTVTITKNIRLPIHYTRANFRENMVLQYFQKEDLSTFLIDCLDYSFEGPARISDDLKYYYQRVTATFLNFQFENKEILVGRIIQVTTKYILVDLGGFRGYLFKNQITNQEIYFDTQRGTVTANNQILFRVGDLIKVMVISLVNNQLHPLYNTNVRVGLSLKRKDLGVL